MSDILFLYAVALHMYCILYIYIWMHFSASYIASQRCSAHIAQRCSQCRMKYNTVPAPCYIVKRWYTVLQLQMEDAIVRVLKSMCILYNEKIYCNSMLNRLANF